MENNYKKITSEKKLEAEKQMSDGQFKSCSKAIHTASVAAAAGGVVPIPVMDSVPITAAQVTMIIALGNIFDQKITDSAAKALIGAAASTLVGRSLVKMIPIAGLAVSAVVAAGVTEAIGWTIAVDFAKDYQKDQALQKQQEDDEYDECSAESAEWSDPPEIIQDIEQTKEEETVQSVSEDLGFLDMGHEEE